jgi:hypothetical protein
LIRRQIFVFLCPEVCAAGFLVPVLLSRHLAIIVSDPYPHGTALMLAGWIQIGIEINGLDPHFQCFSFCRLTETVSSTTSEMETAATSSAQTSSREVRSLSPYPAIFLQLCNEDF